MKLSFHESILRNYASSLGAAIRNSIDPNDPDAAHFKTLIGVRWKDCITYVEENDLCPIRAQKIIDAGIQGQLRFLTSGFIDILRAEISNRNKAVSNE